MGLKTVDMTGNNNKKKKKIVGPNLSADRKFKNFSSVFKSCVKIIFKPRIFLRQILTENKVKSYLYMIALPEFS